MQHRTRNLHLKQQHPLQRCSLLSVSPSPFSSPFEWSTPSPPGHHKGIFFDRTIDKGRERQVRDESGGAGAAYGTGGAALVLVMNKLENHRRKQWVKGLLVFQWGRFVNRKRGKKPNKQSKENKTVKTKALLEVSYNVQSVQTIFFSFVCSKS
jgi:hypothetical protein